MSVPIQEEMFRPALEYAADLAGPFTREQLQLALYERFSLTKSDLQETTKRGNPRFRKNVEYVNWKLKASGLTESVSRGIAKITQKGTTLLADEDANIYEEAKKLPKSSKPSDSVESLPVQEEDAASAADRATGDSFQTEGIRGPTQALIYSIENILEDGCFLARDRLETILSRLEDKKNIILQGPPGTGKTWLAKRLAFALIGRRDDAVVRHFQFHPNLSYEDFVQGWRPGGAEGRLTLEPGSFFNAIIAARQDPESKYIVVIEEINRGNPGPDLR